MSKINYTIDLLFLVKILMKIEINLIIFYLYYLCFKYLKFSNLDCKSGFYYKIYKMQAHSQFFKKYYH